MIRLAPRPKAPPALAKKAVEKRDQLAAIVGADLAGVAAGHVKLPFDAKTYGAPPVKKALIRWQHGKCAFCEAKIDANQYGDVEHFRPKGAVADPATGRLTRSGYWWLAYDWSNLFFVCQICNQAFKKNHFPLVDAARRARGPEDDLTAEAPLLLNPERDEPSEHLGFEAEMIVPRTARGEATVRLLGLDRESMDEARRSVWHVLSALYLIWQRLPEGPDRDVAAAGLRAATGDDAPFLAMTRALVGRLRPGVSARAAPAP